MQRWVGVSNINTLVTEGASGVRLKLKALFSWTSTSTEKHGLILDGRRRLMVKVACERRRSQICNRIDGSQLLRTETRR